MKNYLSYGGGVNSVAMYLLFCEQEKDFEAIFVNHGTDWPETYEYFDMFSEWAGKKGYPAITVLKPAHKGFDNLIDFCFEKKMIPIRVRRWCTAEFKVKPLLNYYDKPCFENIGIDYGERHRAKISTKKDVESRYPLIEAEIDREGCKDIIEKHGLPVPMKSGCFICPFQRKSQWKELRRSHPNLFCKAEKLENLNIEDRIERGKKPLTYLSARLRNVVEEKQMMLFKEDEYPPCQCGL